MRGCNERLIAQQDQNARLPRFRDAGANRRGDSLVRIEVGFTRDDDDLVRDFLSDACCAFEQGLPFENDGLLRPPEAGGRAGGEHDGG